MITDLTEFIDHHRNDPHQVLNFWTPELETSIEVEPTEKSLRRGTARWFYTRDEQWFDFSVPIFTPDGVAKVPFKSTPYNLEKYIHCIGSTGRDWINGRSLWVSYDFDHAPRPTGLSPENMERVIQAAHDLPYVFIHTSRSDLGIHLKVFLDQVSSPTPQHHRQVSQDVLLRMEVDSGFNFSKYVDVRSGNYWLWTKDAVGFRTLKESDGALRI